MNEIFADRTLFVWAIKLLGLAFATGLAAAYYSRVRSGTVHWLSRMETLVAVAAWSLLSWALFVRGNSFGHLPVSNVFEVFQSLGWCTLFFVVFLRIVWGLRVPVVLGTGIAWGLCALGNLNAKNWDVLSVPGTISPGEPWLSVHATLATVGFACFSGDLSSSHIFSSKISLTFWIKVFISSSVPIVMRLKSLIFSEEKWRTRIPFSLSFL